MYFLSMSEFINLVFTLIMYHSILWLSISKDNYFFRIRVNELIRRLFFLFSNIIKNDTIPLISLITAIGVLITLPILIIIKLINKNSNLSYMLANYLVLPWLCLSFLMFSMEFIVYIKKQINKEKNKKIERQKCFEEQKHAKRKTHK